MGQSAMQDDTAKKVRRSKAGNNPPPVRLGMLEGFIGFRLRRAHNRLSRRIYPKMQKSGLHAGEFSALALIAENPGLSQGELALVMGLDKAMIVQLIDKLEKAEWVQRQQAEADRRRNNLHVTPEGYAALKHMHRRFEGYEAALRAALAPQEVDTLLKLLDKVAAAADPR